MSLSRRGFIQVAGLSALAAILVPRMVIAEVAKPRQLAAVFGQESLLMEWGIFGLEGPTKLALRRADGKVIRATANVFGKDGGMIWTWPPGGEPYGVNRIDVVGAHLDGVTMYAIEQQDGMVYERVWSPGDSDGKMTKFARYPLKEREDRLRKLSDPADMTLTW